MASTCVDATRFDDDSSTGVECGPAAPVSSKNEQNRDTNTSGSVVDFRAGRGLDAGRAVVGRAQQVVEDLLAGFERDVAADELGVRGLLGGVGTVLRALSNASGEDGGVVCPRFSEPRSRFVLAGDGVVPCDTPGADAGWAFVDCIDDNDDLARPTDVIGRWTVSVGGAFADVEGFRFDLFER